jgi:hypothetical protein
MESGGEMEKPAGWLCSDGGIPPLIARVANLKRQAQQSIGTELRNIYGTGRMTGRKLDMYVYTSRKESVNCKTK